MILRSNDRNDLDIEAEVLEIARGECSWLEIPSVIFEHGAWHVVGFDIDDAVRTFIVNDCEDANGRDYLELEEL